MSARIHLRVMHPQLDPQEITRILEMNPEHTLAAGRRAASTAAECYWIAPMSFSELEEPWPQLEPQSVAEGGRRRPQRATAAMQMLDEATAVSLAVRRLQAHQDFFHRLADEGGSAALLLNVNSAGSMTIPPTLAHRLADLGLALEVDWSDEAD